MTLYGPDAVEVFERSYTDRPADLYRDRRATALRDCSNPACPARVAAGIPHCCQPCRAHDKGLHGDAPLKHSAKCIARQTERGVRL